MSASRDFIQDAYGDTLKSLFDKLYLAYSDAATDSTLKQAAEQRFSAGVSLALSVRDRAFALLPPNG
jgi:hypothetical protein